MATEEYELCRFGEAGSAISGVTILNPEGNRALVSVQKAGTFTYELEQQKGEVHHWPLGQSKASLVAPAVWDPTTSRFYAVLDTKSSASSSSSSSASSSHSLISWSPPPPSADLLPRGTGASSSSQKHTHTPLSELLPACTPLPAPIHSLFPIGGGGSDRSLDQSEPPSAEETTGGVLCVLTDGSVLWCGSDGQEPLETLSLPASSSPSVVIAASLSPSQSEHPLHLTVVTRALPAKGSGAKGAAKSSHPQYHAHVLRFMAPSDGAKKGRKKSAAAAMQWVEEEWVLTPPCQMMMTMGGGGGGGVVPPRLVAASAACWGSRLSVVWSDSTWAVYAFNLSSSSPSSSSTPRHLAPTLHRHLANMARHPGPTDQSGGLSKRGRGEGEDDLSGESRISLSDAFGDSLSFQALLHPTPGGSQVMLSVLDVQYGCAHSAQQRAPPSGSSLSCVSLGPVTVKTTARRGGGGGRGNKWRIGLVTSKVVQVVEVELSPLSLASVLGALAPSSSPAGTQAPAVIPTSQVFQVGYQRSSHQQEGSNAEGGVTPHFLEGGALRECWRERVSQQEGGVGAGENEEADMEWIQVDDVWDPTPCQASEIETASLVAAISDRTRSPNAQSLQDLLQPFLRPHNGKKSKQSKADVPQKPNGHIPTMEEAESSATKKPKDFPPPVLTAALNRCVEGSYWDLVRQIIHTGQVVSLSLCPELLPALISAARVDVTVLLFPHLADVPAGALLAMMQALLQTDPAKEWVAGMGAVGRASRAAASRALQRAEKLKDRESTSFSSLKWRRKVSAAAEAVLTVQGFRDWEICMHAIIAGRVDSLQGLSAVSQLEVSAVLSLLRYLLKVTTLHAERIPFQVVVGHKGGDRNINSSSSQPPLPSHASTLRLLSHCLDAHFARLVTQPEAAQVLTELRKVVGVQVKQCTLLTPLLGHVEHIKSKRSLPLTKVSPNAPYVIETLSLN